MGFPISFAVLVHDGNRSHDGCSAVGSQTSAPSLAILPPHCANRHDAGCGGAGAGRLDGSEINSRANQRKSTFQIRHDPLVRDRRDMRNRSPQRLLGLVFIALSVALLGVFHYLTYPIIRAYGVRPLLKAMTHEGRAIVVEDGILLTSLFCLCLGIWVQRHTLPNRFSLRTMLIATTLIAVILALAIWAW